MQQYVPLVNSENEITEILTDPQLDDWHCQDVELEYKCQRNTELLECV